MLFYLLSRRIDKLVAAAAAVPAAAAATCFHYWFQSVVYLHKNLKHGNNKILEKEIFGLSTCAFIVVWQLLMYS